MDKIRRIGIPGSFVASRGSATITGQVIKWTIGDIAANAGANGDTVTLVYKVKATQVGIHFNTAEISKTNEKDNGLKMAALLPLPPAMKFYLVTPVLIVSRPPIILARQTVAARLSFFRATIVALKNCVFRLPSES